MKSRIHVVAAQMATFNFYFGSSLALVILRHADNLSKSLQTKDMSAAEGQIVAAMTNSTLKSMRIVTMVLIAFGRESQQWQRT